MQQLTPDQTKTFEERVEEQFRTLHREHRYTNKDAAKFAVDAFKAFQKGVEKDRYPEWLLYVSPRKIGDCLKPMLAMAEREQEAFWKLRGDADFDRTLIIEFNRGYTSARSIKNFGLPEGVKEGKYPPHYADLSLHWIAITVQRHIQAGRLSADLLPNQPPERLQIKQKISPSAKRELICA